MQSHVAALVLIVFIINTGPGTDVTAQSEDAIVAYGLIHKLFEYSNYVYATKVEGVSTGCPTQSVFTREENCLRTLGASLAARGTNVNEFMMSGSLFQAFCRYFTPSLAFTNCMFDTFRDCVNSDLRGLLPDHSRTNDAFSYICNNATNFMCSLRYPSNTTTCIGQEKQYVQATVSSSCSSITGVQSCYRNNTDCSPQYIQTFTTFMEKLRPAACSLANRPEVSGIIIVTWAVAVWSFLSAQKGAL